MMWMNWLEQEPDFIILRANYHGSMVGARRAYGWLIGKDGGLKRVVHGVPVNLLPQILTLAPGGRGSLDQAEGIRPCAPARLRGVLHYFTRGPD